LGVGDPDEGCVSGDCTPELIRRDNAVNRIAPAFVSPETGDFRPVIGSTMAAFPGVPIPTFQWADAPTTPPVPTGLLENRIPADRAGRTRAGAVVVGALLP
jgi:hypothetical protein